MSYCLKQLNYGRMISMCFFLFQILCNLFTLDDIDGDVSIRDAINISMTRIMNKTCIKFVRYNKSQLWSSGLSNGSYVEFISGTG